MSFTITIQGTPISFPSSAESPDWSQGVMEFAQAVESALTGIVGTYDVPPQAFTIDSYNPGSSIDVPNLSFPTANVRAAFIKYAVYRNTTTTTKVEAGTLIVAYNPSNSIGSKWELVRQAAGDGAITFTITDLGQIQFTTTTISGSSHVGKITYSANALEQS